MPTKRAPSGCFDTAMRVMVCVCGVTANSALVAMCVFIVVPVDAVIVHTLQHHMVCVCVCVW